MVVLSPAQIVTSGPRSTTCRVWFSRSKESVVEQPFTVTSTE